MYIGNGFPWVLVRKIVIPSFNMNQYTRVTMISIIAVDNAARCTTRTRYLADVQQTEQGVASRSPATLAQVRRKAPTSNAARGIQPVYLGSRMWCLVHLHGEGW
jgi:hypothetical protein